MSNNDQNQGSSWDSPGEEVQIHSMERIGDLSQGSEMQLAGNSQALYARIRHYAQECRLDAASTQLLEELSDVGADPAKFSKYVSSLQKLQLKQEQQFGINHDSIAYTEMLIGICQQRGRDLDAAVKSLRKAVVRFQQSDESDTAMFVDCLCRTSEIYRLESKLSAARTCIKQAYEIMPYCDGQPLTHCRVLEELSAILFCEHRYRAAAKAYLKLIEIKKKLSRFGNADIVHNLIQLSMCYFSVHDLEKTEEALIEACHLYYDSGVEDKYLNIELLDKMTGVLRHKGLLLQADLLLERSHELVGRLDVAGGHAVYGNLLDEAVAAESNGNLDLAKQRYREALAALESQREKRLADRVPILVRIYHMTNAKQVIQRSSLISDIQDSINKFFFGSEVSVAEGLSQLSLVYRLLGKSVAANDLLKLSQELAAQEGDGPARLGKTLRLEI
ncbi:MAG: hypothetical protein K2X81_21430 [Candidatus Obscuribacterales bacterium]|nr:hypothetical protein [Candidatus Obscuribacterales bacterium]